jgi:hypothetical protein
MESSGVPEMVPMGMMITYRSRAWLGYRASALQLQEKGKESQRDCRTKEFTRVPRKIYVTHRIFEE